MLSRNGDKASGAVIMNANIALPGGNRLPGKSLCRRAKAAVVFRKPNHVRADERRKMSMIQASEIARCLASIRCKRKRQKIFTRNESITSRQQDPLTSSFRREAGKGGRSQHNGSFDVTGMTRQHESPIC